MQSRPVMKFYGVLWFYLIWYRSNCIITYVKFSTIPNKLQLKPFSRSRNLNMRTTFRLLISIHWSRGAFENERNHSPTSRNSHTWKSTFTIIPQFQVLRQSLHCELSSSSKAAIRHFIIEVSTKDPILVRHVSNAMTPSRMHEVSSFGSEQCTRLIQQELGPWIPAAMRNRRSKSYRRFRTHTVPLNNYCRGGLHMVNLIGSIENIRQHCSLRTKRFPWNRSPEVQY